MNEYNPDKWVIVRITTPKHGAIDKVFAGWYGGYLNGDSWKLSSGVVNMIEDGNFLLYHNHSGSVYRCHKEAHGMSGLMSSMYSSFEQDIAEILGATIEILPYDRPKSI